MKKRLVVYFISGALSQLLSVLFFFIKRIRAKSRIFKNLFFQFELLTDGLIVIRQDYDSVESKVINKAILALPSSGCEHYFKNNGCGMCGFNNEIKKYGLNNLHPRVIVFLAKLLITEFKIKKEKKKDTIGSLAIFTGGSFFNKNELPLEAQTIIFSFFAKSDIKRLIVESRPEYVEEGLKRVTGFRLAELGKRMEIAIGLEAADDFIRNGLIRKNISRQEYENAVMVIKAAGFISSTYVLIGAPYLGGEEIIKSAVTTAKFAWQAGTDVVNLEPYSVQALTPWAKYYQGGSLTPPSLWIIAEVVKQVDRISPNWYLGEFSDWPEPIAKPSSCLKCEKDFLNLFKDLRSKHDISLLCYLPLCDCRNI